MQKTAEKVIFPNVFNKTLRLKRVAAYARVSVKNDDMLHSLNAQVSYYMELIGSDSNWEFAGIFYDKPTTGTKEERPQLQQLLEKCRNGEIDMVITKSISRFARNTVTTIKYARELKAIGVDIYFEEERIHTMDPKAELMLTLYAAFAQAESFSTSENCKWRIKKKFEQGIMTPCQILGYDFVGDNLVINETEAELVRSIFKRYLDGKGVLTIANELQAEGAKTKRGNLFTRNDVRIILSNEKYCGDVMLQKWYVTDHLTKKEIRNQGQRDMFYVEGHHDAIIDKDTFEKVQALLKQHQDKYAPKKKAHAYPFTQMLVCDKCKAHYRRKTTAAGTKYEKAVWICMTYNSKGKSACPSRQIPEDILLEVTTKVLNLEQFDEGVFKARVSSISVLDGYKLLFYFKDGTTKEIEWQHKSRSESWTPEMKQEAREKRCRMLQS